MDANDKADLEAEGRWQDKREEKAEARLAAIEARLEILETFVVTLDLPEGTTRVLDRPGPHDHTKIPADGRTV